MRLHIGAFNKALNYTVFKEMTVSFSDTFYNTAVTVFKLEKNESVLVSFLYYLEHVNAMQT